MRAHADYGILYEDTFGVSPEKSVTAVYIPTCPVCGAEFLTEEEKLEHIKTNHPWRWHFWYAPYGKPLLAVTGLSVGGLLMVGLSKAFPPVPKR